MNRLRKLLGLYVALAMLVSSTVGVAAPPDRPVSSPSWPELSQALTERWNLLSQDLKSMKPAPKGFDFNNGTKLGDDTYYPDGRIRHKDGTWSSELGDSSPHGKAQATRTPKDGEGEEEGEGGGGGGSDGGGGGGSGGGGGGGLGGMLGKMMESLLPMLMMMMMMQQQNKNNQPPTPGALPTIPPTFTPVQLSTAVPFFTAVPVFSAVPSTVPSAAPSASRVAAANEATTTREATGAEDTRANTEAALFPTLPPMQ
jgi:hypothetical protein